MNREALMNSFNDRRPRYEKFTKKLETLIVDLISEKEIEYHLIESRTKELSSFKEKLSRKQDNYSSLEDITDLSAIRIIVYYPSDISIIESIFENEFSIDNSNSKTLGQDLDFNQFGYLSSHLVFKLGDKRKSLSEWKYYEDLNCEVQIRTVLQHAWASISHILQYKSKSDIPSSLQRKLYRLAGLFELADEQFEEIRQSHNILLEEIKKDDILSSDRELNMLSVSNYIEKSETVKKIYSLALECGFTDESESPDEFRENYERVNPDFKDRDTKSTLISFCGVIEINSIIQLHALFKSVGLNELKQYFLHQRDREGDDWFVSPEFILILVLIYLYPEKLNSNVLIQHGKWDKEVAKRVAKKALKFKNINTEPNNNIR